MHNLPKLNTMLILAGMSTLFLFTSCKQSNGEAGAPRSAVMNVPTVKAEVQSIVSQKEYPATIEGTINSEVRAKVSGYITEVLVDEGQEVKKGQLLFKLETQSLSQEAAAAKARVEAAEVEVEKLKPLVEKEIISPMQLETAKADLATAKSNYNSVTANIDYSNIKSPVDGILGTINYRKGALVSPTNQTPITTVSAIENVYASFSMNESEYLDFLQSSEGETQEVRIKNFPEVSLKLANNTRYPEKGKIETVSGQINKSTGTTRFRALFPNPNQLLTNGNTATIMLPVHYDSVVVVPEPATFEQQGQVFVFTINENNEATPKRIEVQNRAKGLVIISAGLSAGDQIIAKGVGKIRNGAVVNGNPIPFKEAYSFEPVFK